MNYLGIYESIIERARIRGWISSSNLGRILGVPNVDFYVEIHHVIPKCIGGNNEKNNLVGLTPKEHFIAHYLLTKIYDNDKIIIAFNIMCGKTDGKSANDYGEQIKKYRLIQSEIGKKTFSDPEKRRLASERRIRQNKSPEFRNKLKQAFINNPELKKNISAYSKKRWESPEYRARQSLSIAKFWQNPENKKNKAELVRAQHRDNPELKERRCKFFKRKHNTAEHNKNIGLAYKKYVKEHPEYYKWITERVTGSKNPMARKVINVKTEKIFGCAKEASDSIKMNYSTFKKYLYGKNYTKIDFMWLDEYKNKKGGNQCKDQTV
jgi:hypothetical protein